MSFPQLRPLSRVAWVLIIAAAVATVLIAVAIYRAGSGFTVSGTVSTLESHRVCVTDDGGSRRCAHVDYPGALDGFAVGDCVTIRESAEGFLDSIESADGCGDGE